MSDGTETALETAAEALPVSTVFEQLAARWMMKQAKGTKYGVTLARLGDYLTRKGPATPDELAAVDETTARDILYRRYWLPIAGDKLPEPIAAYVFDVAVRRGTEEAGKLLQSAVKRVEPVALKLDGRIGAQTLTAVEELLLAGKQVALEEQVMAGRTTAVFRLFDGKFLGRDLDLAGAMRIAGIVGKAALAAKTGIKLP